MLDSPPQGNDTNNQNSNIWTEYQDDEGRTYYYNEATQESAWEVPEDAIVQQPLDDDADVDASNLKDDDANDDDDGLERSLDDKNSKEISKSYNESDADHDDTNNNDNSNTKSVLDDPKGSETNDKVSVKNDDKNNDKEESKEWRKEGDEGKEEEQYSMSPPLQEKNVSVWTQYQDDEGRDYYYNAITGQTQWERPDDFVEESHTANDVQLKEMIHENDNDHVHDDQNEKGSATASPSSMEVTEYDPSSSSPPPRDPQEIRIETAETFLSQTDAVLEPEASAHLLTLAEAKGPEVALKTLVSSYMNQTAICGVLCKWLLDVKCANERDGSASLSLSTSGGGKVSTKGIVEAVALDGKKMQQVHAEEIRRIMEEVIAKIAKSNFTENAQQRMLNLNKKERQFFDEMMEHERWRRLLIDLSAQHKDSALLTLLLKSISKRGYHREIAKRINQSDYFEVFHGMLASELVLVGKLGVNGGRASSEDLVEVNSAETIVNDLKRQSTTDDYTYIFVLELLDELIEKSKSKQKNLNGPKAVGLSRATNKWERLREDIFKHMIKPSETSGTLNPLLRKRRADIALTCSELYQRQRRRVRMLGNSGNQNDAYDKIRYSIESGIVNLLKKYSMNTNIDDTILDQLLYNPYADQSLGTEQSQMKIGELLHKYPLVTEYLLRSLFVTAARAKSTETRMKCSKLVAMASFAAQKDLEAKDDSNHRDVDMEEDPIATLSKDILKGSKLCEQVENVVKFVVTEGVSVDEDTTSVGAQLSNLCVKCGAVAKGFLMWARERITNDGFSNSAAYPYIGPGILSLVRIIANHHPLLRSSAIDIALTFLDHSNSELSYQKMNAIKEQALRLLLILATKGLSIDVFDAVSATLKNGQSKFDSGLIRYFVAGALEVIRPPISLAFARSFGTMLLLPPVIDALNAVYFDSAKKEKLSEAMEYFAEAVSEDAMDFARSTSHDRATVDALKSAYTLPK